MQLSSSCSFFQMLVLFMPMPENVWHNRSHAGYCPRTHASTHTRSMLFSWLQHRVWSKRLRRLGGLAGLSLTALTETVAETATHHLQVTHSAGAGGLPPLGLDGPVVCRCTENRNWMSLKCKWALLFWSARYTYRNAAWPPGIRTGRTQTSGCGTTSVRTDGTACASYYGAFQNLKFPSSVGLITMQRIQENIRVRTSVQTIG